MSRETPQRYGRRPSFLFDPRATLQIGGWLTLAAVFGSVWSDAAMWLLFPAGLFVAIALYHRSQGVSGTLGRIGGLAAAGALVAAAVLTLAGLAITGRLGMEPEWLVRSTELVGLATMGGLAALGAGEMRSGDWLTGLLLIAALPLGVAVDRLVSANLHAGFVLQGGGFYLAMTLLAAGLIRLGRGFDLAPTSSAQAIAG